MRYEPVAPHQSSMGFAANYAAILAIGSVVILGWMSGIKYLAFIAPLVVYFIEKSSFFVKDYALQAAVLGIAWSVVTVLADIVMGAMYMSFFLSPASAALMRLSPVFIAYSAVSSVYAIISLLFVAVYGVMIYNAYNYRFIRLPAVWGLSRKLAAALEKHRPR